MTIRNNAPSSATAALAPAAGHRPSVRRLPRWSVWPLAVLALGGAGWLSGALFRNPPAPQGGTPGASPGEWIKVERGDFEVVCREDGELRPVQVTSIGFTRNGKLGWLLPEGTQVKKGERIAALETEDLEDEIQRYEDEKAVAERNLAEQEKERDLEVKRLGEELQAEEDRLALAKLKEREVLSHPTALEKEDAENIRKGAEARQAAARADLEAMAPLIERGYAQRSDLEAKALALKLAETERERARMKARRILAGRLETDRRRARLERQAARLNLQLKRFDREVALDNLEAKLRGARYRIKRLEKRIADRNSKLRQSVRYAPHDGIIVHRTIGWHQKKKPEVGDRISRWYNPIQLPSYEVMKVRTQVPESVVRHLVARRAPGKAGPKGASSSHPKAARGSPARVRIKTLPGKRYTGELIWIDGWARDRNSKLSEADIKSQGLSGVRVFDVEVELHEHDPEHLREGFRAAVEFPLETLHGVIAIPERAVTIEEGHATVRVAARGGSETRELRLGAKSGGRVVVVEGLREGERIRVPPAPASLEPGEPQAGKPGPAKASSTQPSAASRHKKKAPAGARHKKRGPGKGARKGGRSHSKHGGPKSP